MVIMLLIMMKMLNYVGKNMILLLLKKKHGFDAADNAAEAHTKLDGAGPVDNRPSTD